MWSFLKGKLKQSLPSRVVDVGWAVTDDKAALIWDEPAAFRRNLPKPASAKSVQVCPAALDFDARHFVVACPVDLHLRIAPDENKKLRVVNAAGAKSTVRTSHLNKMLTLIDRMEWRHPDRPILQIITPYVFLADEPAWINQIPPYLDYPDPAWPGVMISGRFPVHIWPRNLMWAFEWHDISKELLVARGQPWFYVRFETPDPTRSVRLVEAEITPQVQRYLDNIGGVTNYVNRTYALFDRAKKQRPKQLLVKRVKP